jgi:hypothetical protein
MHRCSVAQGPICGTAKKRPKQWIAASKIFVFDYIGNSFVFVPPGVARQRLFGLILTKTKACKTPLLHSHISLGPSDHLCSHVTKTGLMEFIPTHLALTPASSCNCSTSGNETAADASKPETRSADSPPIERPRHLRIRPSYCGTNIPRRDYSPEHSPQQQRRSKRLPRPTISGPPPPNSAEPKDEDQPESQSSRKAARKISYAEQHLKAILDRDDDLLASSIPAEAIRRKSLNIEVEVEQMELDPNSPTRYVYQPLKTPPASPESASSDDGGFFFRLVKRKL